MSRIIDPIDDPDQRMVQEIAMEIIKLHSNTTPDDEFIGAAVHN